MNKSYYDELKNLIPGFFQGITRVTISYPFDVVKVNMQKLLFNNTKETIKYIVKNDLYRFYRGSSLSYISVGIERSIQFSLIEKMNKKKYNPFISSFILSIFSSIYTLPVQYLTTNIALTHKLDNNIRKYIKELIEKKTNFYKGYLIETSKNTIGSTIFMGSYYVMRNNFGENKYFSPFYGALSGINVWLVIFPLDTIRTEYQSSDNKVKNIIINRYNNYGLKSFYRGITPIIIRTIPSASCGMFVYEYVRQKINLK